MIFGTLLPVLSKVLLNSGTDDKHGHGKPVEKTKKKEAGKELQEISGSGFASEPPSFHDMLIHPNFDEEIAPQPSAKLSKKKNNS